MAASPDKLSSILKIYKFFNVKKYYSGNQVALLLRECVYPYAYFDCMKNLMKQAFLQKKPFILKSRVKILQMKTTGMLKQFGRNLILSKWRITTTCTICLMYYY